jgi:DNA-binding response OmpR family regulator
VPRILVATDSDRLASNIEAALDTKGTTLSRVRSGPAVVAAVASDGGDLVVLDLQMGNMGGMATCMSLRLEESGGRLPHVPVIMLLDRQADVFLARRSGADGWLVKPIDSLRIRRAVTTVLGGGSFTDEPDPGDPPADAEVAAQSADGAEVVAG